MGGVPANLESTVEFSITHFPPITSVTVGISKLVGKQVFTREGERGPQPSDHDEPCSALPDQ
eukprot:7400586-Heterocapsa_arctica.AAC.1